jgi:outer membrane beta-barrel protein
MTMKTRKLGGFFLIACCALLLASPLAFAGGKKGDWEVGLFTGYGALDDYEQSGELPPLNPESDILFGLRFGYFLTEGWSLETSLQRLSTSGLDSDVGTDDDTDIDMDIDSARLNVLYNFLPGKSFRPFLTVGAGLEAAELDGVFDEDDLGFNAGGGLRWFFNDSVSLRLDARYLMVDVGGTVNDWQSNYEGTVGVSWTFGGGPPPDEDGDGVPDRRDRCPGTPRGAIVDEEGCGIDSDGDGVFNGIDECPDTPAGYTVDGRGCPLDSDSDGVNDAIDECPNTPRGATVDEHGCPSDDDKDGVFNGIDKCPDTPEGATVNAEGCPKDSDFDGVYDGIDKCPDTPLHAKVNEVGCPIDTDGDGVFDGIDICPGTRPGVPVNAVGCEILFDKERKTLVLGDINFEFDSDKLTADSEKILDSVAESLSHFADVRVEIAGHTDAKGGESYNLGLSQRRADAVKAYLVGKGIDGSRMETEGYGEGAPIADNSTEDGMAQNRRVELKKID